MNLSKNFTLEELLQSDYASRNKIIEQFNPPELVINNLRDLCENILQPLRDEIGGVIISSGYRCEKVNAGIGGKPTSQHLSGQAADVKFKMVDNAFLFHKIQEMKLPFDQLIWEFGNEKNPAWVHVSYDPKRNRKQILAIK